MLGVVNHGHNFNNKPHNAHNAPEIIDHTVHNDYKEDVSFPQIPPPEFTGTYVNDIPYPLENKPTFIIRRPRI